METFSKTLQHVTQFQPVVGDLEGTCCICGERTKQGNKKKFKANFTIGNMIRTGTVVCPYCQHLLNESNNYRRLMFLLTEDTFKTFKKQDIKEVIFNLPTDEPFYIYITETWQKLGYLLMDNARNEPPADNVIIGCDYEHIIFNRKKLYELYCFISKIRELKISKQSLKTGQISMFQYNKIYGTETREIIKRINKNINNPVWDLALYISD
jgi:hypothetical protein